MAPSPAVAAGQLHRFSKRLVAFEHARAAPTAGAAGAAAPRHTVLFVGGLGDGLLTVSYPGQLAQSAALPAGWRVAQVTLTSSLNGWGTSTLARDARELGECVAYFRGIRGPAAAGGKVVVVGHSTGCQDAMEYVAGRGSAGRPGLDGVVLQAPVSDREAMAVSMDKSVAEAIVRTAREWMADGRGDDVLPQALGGLRNPVSAYRWLSLLSPDKDGDDDYFSSDLPDETIKKTFGAFTEKTPLLILMSGADEHVPAFVDQASLVARWTRTVKDSGGIVDEENSGIVEGAHHNLEQDSEEIVADLCKRIGGFLEKVATGEFPPKPLSQL